MLESLLRNDPHYSFHNESSAPRSLFPGSRFLTFPNVLAKRRDALSRQPINVSCLAGDGGKWMDGVSIFDTLSHRLIGGLDRAKKTIQLVLGPEVTTVLTDHHTLCGKYGTPSQAYPLIKVQILQRPGVKWGE